MKKALLFALILMVLVVFFVACDSNITPPVDTDPPVTDSAEHVHTWSDWIVLTKPTCELGGQEQRYCSVCYELQNKPLEATGHTEVIDQAVPPTCTGTGLTEGKHCSVCRTVLVEQNTVDAAGHIPSAEATCTMAQLCLACNVELVAAWGHTESEWILDKASTCTERGSRHKECTVCKDTVKTETLYLLDHVDSDWIVDRPSTCTEGGYRHKECTSCGMTTHTGTLLALGHTESEWILDKASTCTERGSRHKECTVCKTTVKIDTLFLLDHVDSDWIVDRPSTCTEGGYRHKECISCGTTTHTGTLLALGHNYVASVTPPTLMDDGYTDYVCEFCSDSYTERIVPTSLSINSSNRDWIGYTGATNEELVIPAIIQHDEIWYRVTSIGESAFSMCHSLVSIEIPNSVTSIGDWAFYRCYGLTSITIPDSVTSIGYQAFCDCYNLSSIDLSNSLTGIGNEAFYLCSGLTSIVIPNNVKNIGDGAFCGCIGLCSIVLPTSVTSIGDRAFFDCVRLTDICYTGTEAEWHSIQMDDGWDYNTPDYVVFYNSDPNHIHTWVADEAVAPTCTTTGLTEGKHCTVCDQVLTEQQDIVALGHNYIATIEDPPVVGDVCVTHTCSTCNESYQETVTPSNFTITPQNREKIGYTEKSDHLVIPVVFQSQYGTWYRINGIANNAFYNCTNLISVSIPDSVTSIGDSAFFHCTRLTSVVVPESVTSIGNYAFYGCASLTSINIPDSVTSIGNYAFYGCTSLTSVNIPYSVTILGDNVFSYCTGLTSVVMGNGVTSIGDRAFYSCRRLSSIYYTGTEEQWKAITKGSSWDYDTGDYTIYYNYGVEIPEEPEIPVGESYNVPQDQWVVSGFNPYVVSRIDADDYEGAVLDAAGVESAALLHQGAIYIGELDLSKFSKVIIYNGTDASLITQNHYNDNANNRFILSKVDTEWTMSPAEKDIIASATYTLHGWAVEPFVIDLTDIDYNGPVYVTWDTLPGTYMLVSEIVFVYE